MPPHSSGGMQAVQSVSGQAHIGIPSKRKPMPGVPQGVGSGIYGNPGNGFSQQNSVQGVNKGAAGGRSQEKYQSLHSNQIHVNNS